MGFACTLLGHRYGDVEVEHDREERGGEVITVTREVATCDRCGQERVLSENTEVTSVVDAGDVDVDAGASDDTPTDAETDAGGDGEKRSGPDEPDRAAPGEETGVVDLPGDDAEILESEDGSEDREYGEWPEGGRAGEEEAADRASGEDEAVGADERGFEEIDPAADVPETLSCPDCGFRTSAAGAALRAGDACPDCGDAYLRAESRERNS
jgi:transcription elongation factor Elf1